MSAGALIGQESAKMISIKKLAACTTESERNQLIMDTLAGTYDEASDAFYRNNDALVQSRSAQQQVQDAMAQIGGAVSQVKTALLTEFAPPWRRLPPRLQILFLGLMFLLWSMGSLSLWDFCE